MIDLTNVEKDPERHENKIMYAGKRFYLFLVELENAIQDARAAKVPDKDLGIFAELDVKSLIAAARELGKVPVWNAEETPKFEYKTDVYKQR
jgi:hypothetical protein